MTSTCKATKSARWKCNVITGHTTTKHKDKTVKYQFLMHKIW